MKSAPYKIKYLHKTLFLSLVLFCFNVNLHAQGMTSEQQAKVDSLLQWINLQVKEGKSPDQKYIDSVNAVIRDMNPQVQKKDSVQGIKKDSAKQIEKQSMAGTSFTVPPGKKWMVKRIYVNDGGSYNILVTSLKFDKPLLEGDKLFVPTWCAEAELLNGDVSGFTYIYKIEESDIKK